jgi:1-deoxyxylulose-5-phosphate synthase
MEALDDVVRAGKVRYLGASSMATHQFARMQFAAERHGWNKFVAMQNHYNLIYREEEREMIPFCIDQGVGIVPWSPLARGLLAGGTGVGDHTDTRRAKFDDVIGSRYTHPTDRTVISRVAELASRRGVKPAQIALAWLLGKRWIASPIIGATKLEHIDDAVGALDIRLDDDEAAFLEEPYAPHAMAGFDPRGFQGSS